MLLMNDHIAKHGGGSYCDFLNEGELSRHWMHDSFSLAAERGHAHIVRLFIDLGFDLERWPQQGHSALRRAAENGYFSVVRNLVVELGVGVDGKGSLGGRSSPLVDAEEYGRHDMVAFLVQLGAKNVIERLDDGSKLLAGNLLSDYSRIRIRSGGKYVADYNCC